MIYPLIASIVVCMLIHHPWLGSRLTVDAKVVKNKPRFIGGVAALTIEA